MQELIITPEQLFFLGKMRKAKYLDYGYIEAMKDIRQNAKAKQDDANWALVEKGYAQEDFFGGITLEKWVEEMTDPVFFGEFESTVSLCDVGETTTQRIWRLHFKEGQGVLSVFQEDGIHFMPLTEEGLKGIIVSLLPEGAFEREVPQSVTVRRENIKKIIAFKNNHVGLKAEVKVFFECEGNICCDLGDRMALIAPVDFCNEGYRILKGE